MKTLIIVTLSTLFTLTNCFSQDVITKMTGEDINAKVLEVGETTVKYRLTDSLSDSIFLIPIHDLVMIRYENGTKDIFIKEKDNISKDSASLTNSQIDYYQKGQSDAKKYYKDYSTSVTATLAVSIVNPLIGVIPVVICSVTKPKDKNLNYPNADLMKNPVYYKGYTQNAMRIKQGKIWTNWGIVTGAEAVTVGVLVILYHLAG